ncbi:glycosyltransferase [Rossellomorea marisflavi]|uniref:glycosyltransferase n=1 Tax=Rossellomorea marisflavi TaxID=189381 RepID=UPI0040441412
MKQITYPAFNESILSDWNTPQGREACLTSILMETGSLVSSRDHSLVVVNPMVFPICSSDDFQAEAHSLIQKKLLGQGENGKWQQIFTMWSMYDGDLVKVWRELVREDGLTVVPTTVNSLPLTHYRTSTAIEFQIRLSVNLMKRYLDHQATWFWMPQAAYIPGIDAYLVQNHIHTSFISGRSFDHSEKEGSGDKIRTPRGLNLIPVEERDDALQMRQTPSFYESSESVLARVEFGYRGAELNEPILPDEAIRQLPSLHRMEAAIESHVSGYGEDLHLIHFVREWMAAIDRVMQGGNAESDQFEMCRRLIETQVERHPFFKQREILIPYPRAEDIAGTLPVGRVNEEKQGSVLILSWEYPPNVVGGLSRHVHDLATAFAKKGRSVHVLTARTPGVAPYEKVEGVEVHRVHPLHPYEDDFFKWVLDLNQAFIRYAGELMIHENITLLHAHDWIVGTSARHLKATRSLPLITTIHATEHGRNHGIHTDLQRKIHEEEERLTRDSDHVIVCSDHMKDEVRTLFPAAKACTVIPNGVELGKGTEIEPSNDGSYFFAIGRMVSEKGFETIIQTAERMKKEERDFSVVIAGKGPLLDDYRMRVREGGLSGMINFVGFISDEERNRYLRGCQAVLFPSLYEPFGIVALEAMAYKKTVIASNTGGLKTIVKHEQTGLLFQPEDADDLYGQIRRVMENRQQAAEWGRNGHKLAESLFSWERIAELTWQIYEDVRLEAKVAGGAQ